MLLLPALLSTDKNIPARPSRLYDFLLRLFTGTPLLVLWCLYVGSVGTFHISSAHVLCAGVLNKKLPCSALNMVVVMAKGKL